MHLLLTSKELFRNLYSPEGDGGGGDAIADDSLETFELLNEESAEEVLDLPAPKTKEDEIAGEEDEDDSKEKDDELDDELKELEEELAGPKEEDLELTTPVRRKEILKKYPTLFKDFPYLEKAYYREQQFTEVFPTIPDAKVAAEKARNMDLVERDVMNGDLTKILKAAKQEDQEALYRLADNYLPALKHVDPQVYFHVLGNVVKDTITTMVKEARALGEQGAPLQAAANILNQFVFGSQTFVPPTNLSRQTRPEDQGREQQQLRENQQRVMTQFESTRGDLQTKADNVLKSTIDGHIDPKGTMTPYIREKAVADAKSNLESLISKDSRFLGLLDRLWEKAFERNFDKESTERIKSAYLSKAKTLLPSVIKKARNDALRGLGSRRAANDELEPASKRGPITPGRSAAPTSGKIKSAKDIPHGMSTLDVLNS